MRAFSQSIAAAAVVMLSLAGADAQAACDKTFNEIDGSREFGKLVDQIAPDDPKADKLRAKSLGMEYDEYLDMRYAVQAGYILAQQVRYLGDNSARRDMFDCVHDHLERSIMLGALFEEYGLTKPIAAFKEAVLGIIDEKTLAAFGIDPAKTVESIFGGAEEQWIGTWELVSTTPYIHKPDGSPYPVKNRIRIWAEKDGVWVGFLPVGAAPAVHPQFTETDMTMHTKSSKGTPLDFTLTLDGNSCSGVMHSVTRNGKKLTWKTTGRRM